MTSLRRHVSARPRCAIYNTSLSLCCLFVSSSPCRPLRSRPYMPFITHHQHIHSPTCPSLKAQPQGPRPGPHTSLFVVPCLVTSRMLADYSPYCCHHLTTSPPHCLINSHVTTPPPHTAVSPVPVFVSVGVSRSRRLSFVVTILVVKRLISHHTRPPQHVYNTSTTLNGKSHHSTPHHTTSHPSINQLAT